MPLHKDFQKMLDEMQAKHGAKKGKELFYAFVQKNKLDDTKPMSEQRDKLKKESESVSNGSFRIGTKLEVLETPENIQEGERKWCRVGGTALAPSLSRNKVKYSEVNVTENDNKDVKFFIEHEGDNGEPLRVDDVVGMVKLRVENGVLKYDGRIRNTVRHPDIVEKAQDGLLDVSIDARYDNISVHESEDSAGDSKGVQRYYEITGLDIRALCGVGVGGVAENTMEYAIVERFNEQDELYELAKEQAEVKTKMTEQETKVDVPDFAKENESLKGRIKELEQAHKRSVVRGITMINKDLKESELMEKSLAELEIIQSYEQKLKENDQGEEETEEASQGEEAEGNSEVEDQPEETAQESDAFKGIVRERDGSISMSRDMYREMYKNASTADFKKLFGK